MNEFDKAWQRKRDEGYDYGEDALEQVRFGFELAFKSLVVIGYQRKNLISGDWGEIDADDVPYYRGVCPIRPIYAKASDL